MTIIVCGGRDYSDEHHVFECLDMIEYTGELVVVQGGARGADALARRWAAERGHVCHTVEANWKAHGRAAGPRRNTLMLQTYRPDQVVAFPGGNGTLDMITQAFRAGVGVWYVGR